MATPIHGRRGRLYVGLASSAATPEPVANLRSFDITFSTDDVDATCFGDNNKIYIPGLADITGNFAGFYDTASSQLYTAAIDSSDAPGRRFYLYPTNNTVSRYFMGVGVFDFNIEQAVDDAVKISGSWKANGAITQIGNP